MKAQLTIRVLGTDAGGKDRELTSLVSARFDMVEVRPLSEVP